MHFSFVCHLVVRNFRNVCTQSELIFRTSLMQFVVFELCSGSVVCRRVLKKKKKTYDISHMNVMWKDMESFLLLNLFS